ncbi:MAG TPA: trigger factor [Candidatus Binataceae bacterium]|nr:trigger factor [Candidatus Binataceae bacterium]
MNINVESSSSLRRKITIELDQDEIGHELDRSYSELKRSVHLKGFRPGRAPRQMLERLFGDQVRSEVIQKLIKESTEKALTEHHLTPVAEPEIVTEETDLKKALRFAAVFDIRPEIEVKDYVNLKVPRQQVTVSEEEVDSAMQRLRERLAPLKKVEDRTRVEPGDFVIAELEAFENGAPISGSKLESRLLEVSDKAIAHGLHEVLTGAEVGVEGSSRRSYPADYSEKDLAGKDVEWRFKVNEIFRRELPNLDDEFAKDQGEFQSLAELRDRMRHNLLIQARQEADAKVRQGLLDIVLERNPIEIPQSLLEREQHLLESEYAAALQAGGMPAEQAMEAAHKAHDEFKARAEKRAHSSLVIDALASQENVEVSDEEVAERIATIVTQAGRDRERVANFYSKDENRAAMYSTIRREKALNLLLDRAQKDDGENASTQSADESAGGAIGDTQSGGGTPPSESK